MEEEMFHLLVVIFVIASINLSSATIKYIIIRPKSVFYLLFVDVVSPAKDWTCPPCY